MILWISTSDLLLQVQAAVLNHVHMKRLEAPQVSTTGYTRNHCMRVSMANRHFNLNVVIERTLW